MPSDELIEFSQLYAYLSYHEGQFMKVLLSKHFTHDNTG